MRTSLYIACEDCKKLTFAASSKRWDGTKPLMGSHFNDIPRPGPHHEEFLWRHHGHALRFIREDLLDTYNKEYCEEEFPDEV